MSRKKEFTTSSGAEGMIIDCGSYEVEFFKTKESGSYGSSIQYTFKKSKDAKLIGANFKINWDKESDGGKLEIKFIDRWGSEMIFIHYEPSDLKGMFDFIGRGYNVFDEKHSCSAIEAK